MDATSDEAATVGDSKRPDAVLAHDAGSDPATGSEPAVSCTNDTHAPIPEAIALRPEWEDLHRRLMPLHGALCGLLAALHLVEERTATIAVRWVQDNGGTADEQDEALARFCADAGVPPVSTLLVDLAAQF